MLNDTSAEPGHWRHRPAYPGVTCLEPDRPAELLEAVRKFDNFKHGKGDGSIVRQEEGIASPCENKRPLLVSGAKGFVTTQNLKTQHSVTASHRQDRCADRHRVKCRVRALTRPPTRRLDLATLGSRSTTSLRAYHIRWFL